MNIAEPIVLVGALIGVMLPFIFSALTMLAVGRGSQSIIKEVRRQFKEIPGLLEGEALCDPEKCVADCTDRALWEMVLPGSMAVLSPFVVGFCMGTEALAAMLAGCILSAFMLAVLLSNAGGAWDNAKKACESGMIPGALKGTPGHEANVQGDTVGDPCKDVASVSLDVLAKLMSMIAVLMGDRFGEPKDNWYIGAIFGLILLAFMVFFFVRSFYEKNDLLSEVQASHTAETTE